VSTLPSAPRPNINDMRLSLPTGRGTRTLAPTQKTATSVRPQAAPSTLRAPFPVLQTVRALAPPFRAATPSQIDLIDPLLPPQTHGTRQLRLDKLSRWSYKYKN
jgi:hypothetical protein